MCEVLGGKVLTKRGVRKSQTRREDKGDLRIEPPGGTEAREEERGVSRKNSSAC